MKDFTSQASIDDLPEVVLTFILRLVPPYRDLKHCMLVNKYWCCLVRGELFTITLLASFSLTKSLDAQNSASDARKFKIQKEAILGSL